MHAVTSCGWDPHHTCETLSSGTQSPFWARLYVAALKRRRVLRPAATTGAACEELPDTAARRRPPADAAPLSPARSSVLGVIGKWQHGDGIDGARRHVRGVASQGSFERGADLGCMLKAFGGILGQAA